MALNLLNNDLLDYMSQFCYIPPINEMTRKFRNKYYPYNLSHADNTNLESVQLKLMILKPKILHLLKLSNIRAYIRSISLELLCIKNKIKKLELNNCDYLHKYMFNDVSELKLVNCGYYFITIGSIRFIDFSPEHIENSCFTLNNFNNIKILSIDNLSGIKSISNLPHLKQLNVSKCLDLQEIDNLPSLEELCLDIHDHKFIKISNLPKIKEIEIKTNRVQQFTRADVIENFEQNYVRTFAGNKIKCVFAEIININPDVETLVVSSCVLITQSEHMILRRRYCVDMYNMFTTGGNNLKKFYHEGLALLLPDLLFNNPEKPITVKQTTPHDTLDGPSLELITFQYNE